MSSTNFLRKSTVFSIFDADGDDDDDDVDDDNNKTRLKELFILPAVVESCIYRKSA